MQEQGIISPVPFSNWAVPVVAVVKGDGSVRVCSDYKLTVNQAIVNLTVTHCQALIFFPSWQGARHTANWTLARHTNRLSYMKPRRTT